MATQGTSLIFSERETEKEKPTARLFAHSPRRSRPHSQFDQVFKTSKHTLKTPANTAASPSIRLRSISMVQTSAILLSLVCVFAVVHSTPDAQTNTPATIDIQSRRMLKGTGGRPSGGARPASGNNRPSGGTGTGTSSTVIIVGGGGYYHTNNHGDSTTNQNPPATSTSTPTNTYTGSGSMDPDVYVAAPDVVLPSSGAMRTATASAFGAATLVLAVATVL